MEGFQMSSHQEHYPTEHIHKKLHDFLDLKTLCEIEHPYLTLAVCTMFAESAIYCLHKNNHPLSISFQLQGDVQKTFVLRTLPISEKIINAYDDPEEAVEYGAVGIGLLLIRQCTQFEGVKRARKRTGFDYWLSEKADEKAGTLIQERARLEISGILKGTHAQFNTRIQ